MKILTFFVLIAITASSSYPAGSDSEQSLSDPFQKAMEFYRNRQLDSAYFYFEKAIEADPENEEAYFRRGLVKERQDDLNGAINDYTLALGLSQEARFYNNRGLVRAIQGDLEMAIEDYEAAIELDSGFATAWLNRGAAYHDMNDLAKACESLREASRLGMNMVDDYLIKNCQ